MAKLSNTRSRVRKTGRRSETRTAPPGTHAHSEFELNNDHIEASLRTGEHAGLLEDYFGPEEYAELRQLARDASVRHVRGSGPKVFILPGIMGSKLGKPGRLGVFDDVYWFDPVDIGMGRLRELTLTGARSPFKALGVMLIAYLKLKLRLQIGGYDAEFHAFDWRQSIAQLGREFAGVLEAAGGKGVNIVAHSMGGLVARYALGGGAECKRLIMLGTPNHGSFAAVQALRATYSVVRNVAALDRRHTPEDLVRDVFSTFPGLTQMLPTPEKFTTVDLYNLANWPQPDDGLRPRAAILAGVKAVQSKLAPGDSRFVLIAGFDQETIVGLRKESSGFAYEVSRAGDGTVPLDFARLAGVPTYHVNEAHGSLPNNKKVAQSVLDILDRGETAVLSTTYAEERRAESVRDEAAFRIPPYAGRQGALVSQRELREALADVAAPFSREEARVPGTPPPATVVTQDVIEAGYRHPFDHVVVGRRRQHRIDLRFAFGSITEADTRALAVGVFRDVAPSGAARAIDDRLGGAITEVTRRRMFSSDVGEVMMLPTGRHPIAADYVAFVGLGPFDRFTNEVLQIAAENLIRTFVNCQVEEFATVLFGAGSGEEPGAALQNLLSGLIRGLRDADSDHRFRRIVVCETNEDRYTQLKAELYRLSSTALCQEVEITFDEVRMVPPAAIPAMAPTAARQDPVYLIVRQERTDDDGKTFDVRTSVLTAGAKATVVTGVQTVKEADLQPLITRLVDPAVTDIAPDGERLSQLILSNEVRAVLPRHRDRHLVVVHDAPISRIPWETLALADGDRKRNTWFPAAEKGLTHRYAAENLSVAKWLEQRREDDVLTVLLVVNPTQDLEGAEEEGTLIESLFAKIPGCRLDTLRGAEATRPALLSAFGSGKYDLIHYAGHAFFDATKPEQSGILCHDNAVLSGAHLASVGNLPTLVFFNACEAGRVRGRRVPTNIRQKLVRERLKHMTKGVSFAEAFMRGGVANLLSTYWPVGDREAKVFAETFYVRVMKGDTMGEAIQAGRAAVKKSGSKDWADYIFYGAPDFALKARTAAR